MMAAVAMPVPMTGTLEVKPQTGFQWIGRSGSKPAAGGEEEDPVGAEEEDEDPVGAADKLLLCNVAATGVI